MWPLSALGESYVRRVRGRARLALGLLEDRSLPGFLAPVDYAVGTNPTAMASGLFNSDAIPDLVVANYSDSTVSVLLGNGDGTFQAAVNSPTGANPLSVAVGDFDADGKTDLATANAGDVSVLLGNGDGTFQAPASLGVGASPASVAVGDFNADGKMDLGVTSNTYIPGGGWYYWYPGYYVGQASVLLGTGTGSFGSPLSTGLSTGYHQGAAAEDVNGDGRDDFMTSDYDYGQVAVLLAGSTGALQGPTYFNAGYYPGSVAAGDLNGDSKADLVVGNGYGNTVSVLLGNGLGGFGAAVSYAAGVSPTSIVIGDFNGLNGDGKPDVALATADGGLGVILGKGNGTFTPPVLSATTGYLHGVAAGDFNGDGWLDAAAVHSSASAAVFANDEAWPALDAPSITVTDVTLTEGNTGTVSANFQVTLSASYAQPVTVKYATVDGGATTADGDYQAVAGTLTFAPGETSKPVSVLVNGDRKPEWTEGFTLRLSDATNAFLADAAGVGTVQDDEPTVSIIDSVTGPEGNAGTSTFTFTVTLSSAYDIPVSVDYATRDLTPDEEYWYGPAAAAGTDYQSKSGTLTIPAGQTTGMVTVSVNGDTAAEWDELFFVDLGNPTTAHLGWSQSLANIQNDEPYVSINSPAAVKEGHSGTTALTFTVTLSAPSTSPVTVTYATADGGAVAPGDYASNSGTVTFAPGETSKPVSVLVNGDRVGEGDEWFYVNLTAADGAGISSGTGYGTILDDEPRISINTPAAIKEGHRGTTLLTFTVTLSAAYDQSVTVNFATQDSSAKAGEDYVATSGTVTFAAGQTTRTFTVAIKGDKKKEQNESFYVRLSAPSGNASISTEYGYGTILNDDGGKGPH